jgi:signal transduction histidine kinase
MNISTITGNALTIFTGLLVYGFFLVFCIALTIYYRQMKSFSSIIILSTNVWVLYAIGVLQIVRLLFLGLTFSSDSIFIQIFPLLTRYSTFLVIGIFSILFFPHLGKKSKSWTILIILTLPLILGFISSSINGGLLIEGSFSHSPGDWLWLVSMAIFCTFLIIVLLVKKAEHWKSGIFIFSELLTFLVLSFFLSGNSNDFYPMMFAPELLLFMQLPAMYMDPRKGKESNSSLPAINPSNYLASPVNFNSIQAWLKTTSCKDPKEVTENLVEAISRSCQADLALIVFQDMDADNFIFPFGYNLFGEYAVKGFSLKKEGIPLIASALNRKETLLLTPQSTFSPDAPSLSKGLGFKVEGAILVLPVKENADTLCGFILLSPFSQRSWKKQEIETIEQFVSLSSQFITTILKPIKPQKSEKESKIEFDTATDLIEQLQAENKSLILQLKELDARKNLEKSAGLKMDQNEALLEGKKQPEIEHLEAELRLTLEEVARLQNNLAEANIRIHNLQSQTGRSSDDHDQEREVLASIVQEIRQPMTSIIGYADLMAGESVGNLNAFQRKFIDRVKAASERMQILLDDLIQISEIQTGHFEIHPILFDPNEVIDQALLSVRGQMREKSITLRIDVPKRIPQIIADRAATQQIVIRLLHNACLATPENGVIIFRVMSEKGTSESEKNAFLRIQVTDSGGGIPPENIPNVFTPRFRTNVALLQGVGETGVGLYLSKLLVEAHKGNIWVESDQGKTTTINVLLPTHLTSSLTK